eukprot:11366510-Alexandrium_andersonii.AAC.1
MSASLVGSEMCIRDSGVRQQSCQTVHEQLRRLAGQLAQLPEDVEDVPRGVRAGSRHLGELQRHLLNHGARSLANAPRERQHFERDGGN